MAISFSISDPVGVSRSSKWLQQQYRWHEWGAWPNLYGGPHQCPGLFHHHYFESNYRRGEVNELRRWGGGDRGLTLICSMSIRGTWLKSYGLWEDLWSSPTLKPYEALFDFFWVWPTFSVWEPIRVQARLGPIKSLNIRTKSTHKINWHGSNWIQIQ